MDIVLICHGEEKCKNLAKTSSLSKDGEKQVDRLKDTLDLMKLQQPEVFLKICEYKSVNETTDRLVKSWNRSIRVRDINLPEETDLYKDEDILKKIIAQAKLSEKVTIVVGPGPTLNLILTRLTSRRVRGLDRAEAVWVQAQTMNDFLRGKGEIYCRIPVADYREEALRSKIQSDMTISTVLAGFAVTVLFGLLNAWGTQMMALQIVTILLLTAALLLFIVAMYIYDLLAMPEGFWLYGGRRILFRGIRRRKNFEDNRRERGPLYAYMVWTWNWIFSFGVIFLIAGFILTLFTTKQCWLIAGGLVLVVAGFVLWWFARPTRSFD